MSQYFAIHPDNPQLHLLRQTVAILENNGVIVYPTESGYALGCRMGDKASLTRIKRIRQLDDKHHFTLMCRDLSELASYAQVDNSAFRLLKACTPGPYTFILKATKDVPRRLQHPKRKTIGIRVSENTIAQAMLESLGEPIITTSLVLPHQEVPLIEPEAIRDILGKQVELVIDGGYCGIEQTTVVDLLEAGHPKVLRYGKGDAHWFAD